MAKTANLYARIEPELKEQAEVILNELGIPVSNAINMFYKQIVLQKGLPFELKLPPHYILNTENLTEDKLDAELEKGFSDAATGKTKSVDKVFSDIHRDFGI